MQDKSLKAEKIKEFEYGVRPDGNRIGQYRNPFYKDFKQRKNPKAGGTVDLILTGQFTNGLYLTSRFKRAFIFESRDKKSENLKGKYGMDIMGLNEDFFYNKQKFEYAPLLIIEIKRYANIG